MLSDLENDILSNARSNVARRTGSAPATRELIVDVARTQAAAFGYSGSLDQIIRELESEFIIQAGEEEPTGGRLSDGTQEPWLRPEMKADWPFWYRYREFLKQKRQLDDVGRLDHYTDRILEQLGNPGLALEQGGWDRRGLVVGHVQSGKTENYTGLICKATDAGYRVIVVLTGIHEALRVQTQERLEEGFTGILSSRGGRELVGVGHIRVPGRKNRPVVSYATTSDPNSNGDFSAQLAHQFGLNIEPAMAPLLLVVKKNARVLFNLVKWIANIRAASIAELEHQLLPYPETYKPDECPLLVIDDEADQASVDTRPGGITAIGEPNPHHDPTTINKLIRVLLRLFGRRSYVAYTATPFANILIHDEKGTDLHGPDLFPKNFIVSLPAPRIYIGPARVFGYEGSTDTDGEPGFPELLESVDDHADSLALNERGGWMPPIHMRGHIPRVPGDPDHLPASLKSALMDYTLAGAGRVCRGQGNEHHSMLIHVTRFQAVQNELHATIEAYWQNWVELLRSRDPVSMDLMRRRWEASHSASYQAVSRRLRWDVRLSPVSWTDLITPREEDSTTPIERAVSGVQVKQVHGGDEGVELDYRGGQLKVIAIGGNKLSRGLTLEGLTVSYFLRTSRMYDTLMQMGRWFGYRTGYLDLCRLYMPPDLEHWFGHLAQASEELRGEFDRMVAMGATPNQYGQRVISHPTMVVTSQVKMRDGTTIRVAFSDTVVETTVFDRDLAKRAHNVNALQSLLDRIGPPDTESHRQERPEGKVRNFQGYLWRSARHQDVEAFLRNVYTHRDAPVMNGQRLADYIARAAPLGELTEWWVLLRKPGAAGKSQGDAGLKGRFGGLKPVQRKYFGRREANRFSIKRLLDGDYESLDIDLAGYQRALDGKRREYATSHPGLSDQDVSTKINKPYDWVRRERDPRRGLLLIYLVEDPENHSATPFVGLGLSFPVGQADISEQYVVNNVYMKTSMEAGMLDDDDEDDDDI